MRTLLLALAAGLLLLLAVLASLSPSRPAWDDDEPPLSAAAGAPLGSARAGWAQVGGAVPNAPAGDEAASGAAAAAGDQPAPDAIAFRRRALAPGEAEVAETTLALRVTASVGVGLLRKDMEFRLDERERVRLAVLPPDGEATLRRLDVLERTATSKTPMRAEQTKERRLHGRGYLVRDAGGVPQVSAADGGEAPVKQVEDVLEAWRTFGGDPPLFAALPEGDPVHLSPGTRLALTPEEARRLLNLPFSELDIADLQLVLDGLDERGAALFDVSARLSGQAELGGAATRLNGRVAGTARVDPDTARLLDLDLTGRLRVRRDGDGVLLEAEGSGPLVLSRRVRADG